METWRLHSQLCGWRIPFALLAIIKNRAAMERKPINQLVVELLRKGLQ